MLERTKLETLRIKIDNLENQILYMKGKMRAKTKRKYLKLLKSSTNKLGLNEPIYLMRYE